MLPLNMNGTFCREAFDLMWAGMSLENMKIEIEIRSMEARGENEESDS